MAKATKQVELVMTEASAHALFHLLDRETNKPRCSPDLWALFHALVEADLAS